MIDVVVWAHIVIQVPQQSNNDDCGLYVIYFARAVVEALSWVRARVQQQVLVGVDFSRASRYSDLVDVWGKNYKIELLRAWIFWNLTRQLFNLRTETSTPATIEID